MNQKSDRAKALDYQMHMSDQKNATDGKSETFQQYQQRTSRRNPRPVR